MIAATPQTPGSDPIARLNAADPYPVYAELRESAPVHWSASLDSWVLTRYQDVRAVLAHPDFRVDDPARRLARVSERGGPPLANLTAVYSCIAPLIDPDRNAGMKRVFAPLLASWRDLGLRERLAARATALLEEGARCGSIDLAAGYARKLAVFAFGTLLGIPESEHEAMCASVGINSCVSRALHSLRELVRLEAEAKLLVDRFRGVVSERRAAQSDDAVGRLLRAADAELGWSEDALAGFCAFLLGAARETTSTGIGGCAMRLLVEPGLRSRLRRDPGARPAALRELLRLVAPFQYVSRIAVRDTVVSGQSISRGQAVCAFIGAANRDAAAFPDPDRVDLERRGPEPLTFSAGWFRCLGEQLATLELAIALDCLLEFPTLRLGQAKAVWGPPMHILELRHVPAVFTELEHDD